MRVARDPLAVREVLLQEGVSGQEPMAVTLLPGEATITLARGILFEGSADRMNWRRGDMHYLRHEACSESAAQATAFAPTSEDREDAVELNSDGAERSGTSGFGLLHFAALCVLAILLFVMLQLIVS